MESIVAHPSTGPTLNFRQRWTAGLVRVCPPNANVTRSNRVGRASFFLFHSAKCAIRQKFQLCFIRVSKQNPKKKSSPNADRSATDDVGRKLACVRTAIVSISGRIGARRPSLTPVRVGTRRYNRLRMSIIAPSRHTKASRCLATKASTVSGGCPPIVSTNSLVPANIPLVWSMATSRRCCTRNSLPGLPVIRSASG